MAALADGRDVSPVRSDEGASGASARLVSVDLVRGAVMVLMALDHVRVYSGIPAGGPTVGIFLTRWVTHFCAPAFVFLAGTAACLQAGRLPGRAAASRLLALRGAWLILLELTVIRIAWTFNLDFRGYLLAGVLWVIGWSMVLLAGLLWLPRWAVAAFGLAVVCGHNLLDPSMRGLVAAAGTSPHGWLWKVLYVGFFAGPIEAWGGGPRLFVLYSLVPWVGVMAAGWAFGPVLTLDTARRRRVCLALGLSSIALFVLLRGLNLYGDPRPWAPPSGPDGMPGVLAFLNTTKYPASLSFLLMTLGPAIAVLPLLEGASGPVARWLAVFGRVPLFYYLLHIPLAHALAVAVSGIRQGQVSPWLFANHPMGNPPAPEGYMWSLPLLYATWAVAVLVLYLPCRWFAGVKARRRDWWLRFL
jgi:uncharacterized membrane protein